MNPDSPLAIEQELQRFVGLLDKATQLIAERAREAAKADAAYRTAYAKARLAVRAGSDRKMTVDEVSDRADELTEAEYLAKVSTEAVLRSARDASQNLRSQIDAIRSLLASQRYLLEKA